MSETVKRAAGNLRVGPLVLLLAFISRGPSNAAAPVVSRVSSQEEARWRRWVIPLPQQISIEEKAEVAVSGVKIKLCEGAGDVAEHAATRLADLFKEKGGIDPGGGDFEIVIGVCSRQGRIAGLTVPEASKLGDLPNAEQAYCISPAAGNRLILTALDERGVFYAALTLRQLLEGTFAHGKVAIPLARIVDWPDLRDRGLVGANSSRVIKWLAERKLNRVETMARLLVKEDGQGVVEFESIDVLTEGVINPPHLSDEVIEEGRLNALNVIPTMGHLDYWADDSGYYSKPIHVYDVYPEIQGKGESAWFGRDQVGFVDYQSRKVVPCSAEPNLIKVLADWMMSIASHKGVGALGISLSEYPLHCGCPKCRNVLQGVGEARAILKAWGIARKKYPDLGLGIFLTNGTFPYNDKVLAEIPEGVGVYYYHATKTYTSSREPMIPAVIADYAAKGRWVGVVPQLTASWTVVCPWSGPQFIRSRITEVVDKQLSCLLGFATPNSRLYDFNLTAAAEWSWNTRGRSEREFSAAWATRKGFQDADAVADWAVMLGPVSWDVYGSGVPYDFYKGERIVEQVFLKQRKAPTLGKDIFLYYPEFKHFDDNIAVTERALAIARRVDSPILIAETLVIQGYTRLLKNVYVITRRLSMKEQLSQADRTRLAEAMSELADAAVQISRAMHQWEGTIGQRSGMIGIGGHRFRDSIKVTERTVASVQQELNKLGIESD